MRVTSPSSAPSSAPTGASRAEERAERAERTKALLDEARVADRVRREELVQEVVVLNRSVAEALANRYRNRGVPHEDLEQAAFEGLIKAVRRFDPELRPNLLTYAVPTIRGEIQRYFRDHSWMIRPPRRIQELQWKINRASDSLSQELGREPTTHEMSHEVGCSAEELDAARQGNGAFRPASLDRLLSEAGPALGDLIADQDDDEGSAVEARLVLAPAVRRLSARDRRILYMRFFEERSQLEIGEQLGVTQMQVSRLLARILRQLRKQLDDASTSRQSGQG